MVEVAYFRSGITQPVVAKDVLRHIGGGGLFASAKIALDTPAPVGCRTYVDIEANGGGVWESASLTPTLESPRRQVIRNMFASRNERQAVREQRRLEIERELLTKLGMSSDGSKDFSPNGALPASAASIDNTDAIDGQSFGNEARPPSRSTERPGSGRRAGLSASSSGPPRPPKPKPHRPLNLNEDNLPCSETSADNLPEERRWKSALLPVWPDRQGNSSPAVHAPDSCHHCVQGFASSSHVTQVRDCTDNYSHVLQSHDSRSHGVALSPSSKHSANDRNTMPMAGTLPQSNAEAVARCGNESLEQETDSLRRASPPLLAPDVIPTLLKSAPSEERAVVVTEGKTEDMREEVEQERRPLEVLPRAAQLKERTQELAASFFPSTSDQSDIEVRRKLAASAQRLRDNVERLRLENRRSRVFGSQPSHSSIAYDSVAIAEHSGREEVSTLNQVESASLPTDESLRRLEEMRRKIAELDKVNELERELLEKQEMEAQERQRQQEEFERGLQECTEQKMQEHRDQEAEAELKQKEREEEKQREREERLRRRRVQLHQEEEKSRRLEKQRREGRSEAAQQKWQLFEQELDRQWADQEEERRRVDTYAKERRRRFEALDRRLASERQKFASEAEFTEAARRRQARNAAHADEQFYSFRHNVRGVSGNCPSNSVDSPRAPMPPPRHPPGKIDSATPILIAEECAVLQELHGMQNQSRDSQKAKVKELLFRWHPDKNPTCSDKATRVFQFVQKQREIILGL